ncbi:MAG: hypothetical protein ACRDRK_01320 [Pseudonocardia sp.]
MRDVYATDVEKDRFATWLRGEPLDPTPRISGGRHGLR